MADFELAYKKTMGFEGMYDNDPDDPGGETYKGIARVHHADWQGWPRIDELKSQDGFPESLSADPELQSNVRGFYKEKYWDIFKGDLLENQDIAEELFDTGVNMGSGTAARFLQRALNALNRNQISWPDVVETSSYTLDTLSTLTSNLLKNEENLLYKLLNIQQGARYLDIMRSNPKQEKYARGWLSRVEFKKS